MYILKNRRSEVRSDHGQSGRQRFGDREGTLSIGLSLTWAVAHREMANHWVVPNRRVMGLLY